jgi:4-hydroxyphenylpyruvate dioxygenase
MPVDREAIVEVANPLGIDGIEFIEYSTSKPQALGQVLEIMGFKPVARHRSREVLLYRQGDMNVVVNAHAGGIPLSGALSEVPSITGLTLRVRDASAAYQWVLDRGGWAVPREVEVMELHIPAIYGVGASKIYFVDRYNEFSIYDVDFVPVPGVDTRPPALAGLHWFGIVQYIGNGRMDDWLEFYDELFGFKALSQEQQFGILPKGRILRSPCRKFYLQLIEPMQDVFSAEIDESFQRIAFGAADVPAAVQTLRERGVRFVELSQVHTEARGALTTSWLGGLMFELVHSDAGKTA